MTEYMYSLFRWNVNKSTVSWKGRSQCSSCSQTKSMSRLIADNTARLQLKLDEARKSWFLWCRLTNHYIEQLNLQYDVIENNSNRLEERRHVEEGITYRIYDIQYLFIYSLIMSYICHIIIIWNIQNWSYNHIALCLKLFPTRACILGTKRPGVHFRD